MEKIYKKAINARQLSLNAGVTYGKVNEALKYDKADFLKKAERELLIQASEKAYLEFKKFLS